MRKFIGLVFSMGLIFMPSYKKYWSKDLLFKNKPFPSVMSRERFESIMQFFSFGEKPLFENDRLSKLQMILDVITPERNISVDESMMLSRGRLVFRQCDGLFLTVQAYGSQGFNDEHNLGQTAAIALKLMNPFVNKDYTTCSLIINPLVPDVH